MKKIRCGVVGTGKFGTFHANKYAEIENVEFVGIFDTNINNAKKITQKHPINVYQNLDDLLHNVDAISIATPAQTHYKIADQALEAHCHILVEKPTAINVQQVKRLITKAREKNLIIHSGYQERHLFLAIFNSLHGEKILRSFRSHRTLTYSHRNTDISVVLDLMVHDIDFLLHITQSPIKMITAIGQSISKKTLDHVETCIIFGDGTHANLLASRIYHSNQCYVINQYDDEKININFLDKKIVRRTHPTVGFEDIITPYYKHSNIDVCNDPLKYNIHTFIQYIKEQQRVQPSYDTLCNIISLAVKIEDIAYNNLLP